MAGAAVAEQTYRWTEVFADAELPAGASVNPANGSLVITGEAGVTQTVSLLTIDDPAVDGINYGLSGRVAYQGVEGEGYLEMWNVFAGGKRFFTRTLSDGGPLGKITGTSVARDFLLPFNRSGTEDPPLRLEINLVLPGAGIVTMDPVILKNLKYGSGLAGKRWRSVAIWSGGGIALVSILLFRRVKLDGTEARKMKAMDL
jgi:hypothetical protein